MQAHDECHCDCHGGLGAMHVMPCCEPCPLCQRRILPGLQAAHEIRCREQHELVRAHLASPTAAQRREEMLWVAIENLQDALHKVEWVRSHAGQWICAFCGGVSIEHGGDDHREGCEWQRLMLFGPQDVTPADDAVDPHLSARGADERPRATPKALTDRVTP